MRIHLYCTTDKKSKGKGGIVEIWKYTGKLRRKIDESIEVKKRKKRGKGDKSKIDLTKASRKRYSTRYIFIYSKVL